MRRLGARFVVDRVQVDARGRTGDELQVEIALKNRGFAPLYNARAVEIVLQEEESGAVFPFPQPVDPRTWKPGQRQTLKWALSLPEDMPPGTYQLGLFLPDVSPRLRADPRYAYRLANKNTWDVESGYNVLARGIVIGDDNTAK